MIPAQLMTSMRNMQLRFLKDTSQIWRPSNLISNSAGGQTGVLTYLYTYPCRFVSLTSASDRRVAYELLVANMLADRVGWMVTYPYGADVTTDDKILDTVNMKWFEIIGLSRVYEFTTALRVIASEAIIDPTRI